MDPNADIPGAPSDNTTLLIVLEEMARDGWAGDMFVTDGGGLRCGACRAVFEPSTMHLDRLRRLEGASDPADMQAVLALHCPHCGARGTAVVAYGPDASEDEAKVLLAVEG